MDIYEFVKYTYTISFTKNCLKFMMSLIAQDNPWVGKIPWRRKWQPTPVVLPGESHGGRSLVGYSPWGHKESDMTERLHFQGRGGYCAQGLNFFKCLRPREMGVASVLIQSITANSL